MDQVQIQTAFILFRKGNSLRKVSRLFRIGHTSLKNRFIKTYGKNYASLKVNNGVFPIIEEYLNSPDFSDEQKLRIKEWLNSNIDSILLSDLNHKEVPLYTEWKIQSLTYSELGRAEDLREIIEQTLSYN